MAGAAAEQRFGGLGRILPVQMLRQIVGQQQATHARGPLVEDAPDFGKALDLARDQALERDGVRRREPQDEF